MPSRLLPTLLAIAAAGGLACGGFMIPATINPDSKLAVAQMLLHENRALPAEQHIHDALAIFTKRGDVDGIARAHLLYGMFFACDAPGLRADYYREHRFLDREATFAARQQRAIEHLALAEGRFRETSNFAALTTLHYWRARALGAEGKAQEACSELEECAVAHRRNLETNPDARPTATGYSDVPDAIADARRVVGCNDYIEVKGR